jgi:hypothetical protein
MATAGKEVTMEASPRSSTSSALSKHITTTLVEPLSPTSSARQFLVYKNAFRRHYDLRTTPDGPILYYGDISEFTIGTPDLTLHEGKSAKSPVVAAIHYGVFTRAFKFGIAASVPAATDSASPTADDDMRWEDVTKDSAAHGYIFSTDLARPPLEANGGGSSNMSGDKRRFIWKRTRTVGVEGDKPSMWSSRNWKLVEAGAQRGSQDGIIAVFTSDRTLTKAGTIEVRTNHGLAFDRLVFVTALALYEKDRRRAQSSSSGGG